jgi:L-fuculose-phosphate aldolase
MEIDEENIKNQLIEVGIEAFFKGLVWGSSGNISCRLDEKRFLISGAKAQLDKLEPKDFVRVNIEGGSWEGEAKPSLESRMHTEIYKSKDDVRAVFHSQPFFTTFVSCTDLEVDIKLFPESMAYIENIERISYHHPGSEELAKAVSEKINDCDVLILNNHGAICAAENLEDVLLKTETLEMLCRLTAFSKIGNIELNFLSQNVRDDFIRHLREKK